MYVKIETSIHDYFHNTQHLIWSEVYQGIIDNILIGETNVPKVGKRIILPSSFTGVQQTYRSDI